MSMAAVNVHEAKTQFSKLLAQVEQGGEVVIARAGVPVARLVPYVEKAGAVAAPGGLEGQGYWIAEDFDAPVDTLFDALR